MRHPDEFDAERKGKGVVGDAVFQAADNPNDVTAWHDFETLDSARRFIDSERLRDVMTGAGVAGVPTIWLTTPA
ncbi:MAG: cyclase [Gemmatimonadales bacterium]|nr:cyclase [Gemmatimonadales bacterium]